MRNKIGDKQRVEHIVDAIEFCVKIASEMSKEEFLNDRISCLAIERQLEIIGEASNHISDELKMNYESADWNKIIAFRNFIAHEYFKIDYDIIWRIINSEIVELNQVMETIIKNENF